MSQYELLLFEDQINESGLNIRKMKRPSGKWMVELFHKSRIYYRASSSKSMEDAMVLLMKQISLDADKPRNDKLVEA